MPSKRGVGAAAALVAVPAAAAYRFAVVYRTRAGFPRRHVPMVTPAELGLPYESLTVEAPGADLPAWLIPAMDGAPGPGVVLVHGWESARDRTLPTAQVLHAAGFHVLTLDVRGHGANPPEDLPVSGGEFGTDAAAAVRALAARPEVTRTAIVGHSMGGIGSILAAAAEPRVEALVAASTPADPVRLTRQTFRLADLPIPDPVAWPLAWLTSRVYVRPRRHAIHDISAARAIARYRGPVLLVHGTDDTVVPPAHLDRLAAAARAGRADQVAPAPIETLLVEGGAHSWLYEHESYRRAVASFLARSLGGPYSPVEAADRAAAVPAQRIPEAERTFAAIDRPHPRLRTLAELAGARVARPETEPPMGPSGEPEAAA
jgi:dipeptidyl aminopeptidase/acylaminoacyl peptidase